MLNFNLHTTTEIVFGKDIEEQIGPRLKELGVHRILVHFGGSSARTTGLLDRVEKSLLANPNLTLILISHHLTPERKKQFDKVYELSTALNA